MSVATTSHYPQVNASILSGNHWLPPSSPAAISQSNDETTFQLNIEVPEFGISFVTDLDQVETSAGYSLVSVGAYIDPGVLALITLHNEVADDAGNLTIKNISINFTVNQHRPRAHFIASSLYALLALAGPVNITIPSLNVDLKANFTMPLPEISKLLQSRQTHYGLMVIEYAAGLEFNIPDFITSEDMNALAFSYHAIVDREFIWITKFDKMPVPATQETLEWITSLRPIEPNGSVYRLSFGPEPATRIILDQSVNLGPETVFIEDAVFINFEEVVRGLSQLDGHTVHIELRSLGGLGRYVFSSPPQPPSTWEDKILACLALEEQLNQRLAAQYNALAASTLADLTSEEVELITSHSDEDDFLLTDEK